MTNLRKHGFSLVELLMVVAVVAVVFIFGVKFYKKDYAKVKISNAVSVFEPIKIALTEFRAINGDLRKTNAPDLAQTFVKLNMKPLDLTSEVSKIRIWSLDKNKVQVLICMNEKDLGLAQDSKLGLLYDGVYNGNQLNWQCGFQLLNSKEPKENIMTLLPENCRTPANTEILECN